MKQLIAEFPDQLTEAIEIGKNSTVRSHHKEIQHVIMSGLGGSGIGGSIVQELIYSKFHLPFTVNKRYVLPEYTGENSLVIISSYSGNTEETVEALNIAIQRKAKIVAVTSGGKIAKICRENDIDLILIPSGKSSPRACLGYSLIQQFFILHKLNLISDYFIDELLQAKNLIVENQDLIKKESKQLADLIYNKIPVIYSPSHQEGVAVRWRQQINENSKMLCWHHAIPEMNHNELVGWREKSDNLAVLFIRNDNDYSRIQKRIEINKEIISEYCNDIFEIWSKGNSGIERSLYLINFGDWLSYYLSELKQVDPIEVKVIDYLKSELSK
jgi:glucose/mannose-6-phosphate isomerase